MQSPNHNSSGLRSPVLAYSDPNFGLPNYQTAYCPDSLLLPPPRRSASAMTGDISMPTAWLDPALSRQDLIGDRKETVNQYVSPSLRLENPVSGEDKEGYNNFFLHCSNAKWGMIQLSILQIFEWILIPMVYFYESSALLARPSSAYFYIHPLRFCRSCRWLPPPLKSHRKPPHFPPSLRVQ